MNNLICISSLLLPIYVADNMHNFGIQSVGF